MRRLLENKGCVQSYFVSHASSWSTCILDGRCSKRCQEGNRNGMNASTALNADRDPPEGQLRQTCTKGNPVGQTKSASIPAKDSLSRMEPIQGTLLFISFSSLVLPNFFFLCAANNPTVSRICEKIKRVCMATSPALPCVLHYIFHGEVKPTSQS